MFAKDKAGAVSRDQLMKGMVSYAKVGRSEGLVKLRTNSVCKTGRR